MKLNILKLFKKNEDPREKFRKNKNGEILTVKRIRKGLIRITIEDQYSKTSMTTNVTQARAIANDILAVLNDKTKGESV